MIPPVVEVAALKDLPPEADPAWGEWLSAAELEYCAGRLRVGEHLAVRLLAKRAAVGALKWLGDVPWTDVEVQRCPRGSPSVKLGGALDEWRREHDLPVPGVSLTHAGGYAAAVAWLPEQGSA